MKNKSVLFNFNQIALGLLTLCVFLLGFYGSAFSQSCYGPVGYTQTDSATDFTFGGGYVDCYAVTINSAVTVIDFQFYAGSPATGSIGLAIYSDNGLSTQPVNLLTSITFTPTPNSWNLQPITNLSLSAGVYWLAYWVQNPLGASYGNSNQVNFYQYVFSYASSPPNPMINGGNSGTAFPPSIFVDTFCAVTPTYTPTLTPTNTPTNTVTNTPTNTVTNTITNTPAITFTPTATITNTPTGTSTFTVTFTPTNTFAITPTPTITNTPTPMATFAPTGLVTTTPTPNVALYLDSNVFNPNVQPLGMDVRVDTGGEVKILIFNMAGEEVEKLADQSMTPGNYRFSWDGHNGAGAMAGNGMYFLVIEQPSGRMIKKVVVLK